ncbi:peptidylprolyl isomerase fpr3 [Kickxella alabastrina]|nr:peptidylprolyl isomerase fpr3 [Kickxella alabastrina]
MEACGIWGLRILPNKTYSQTVDAAFRLTNAAFTTTVANASSRTSVVLTIDKKASFVLCSLTPGVIEQQPLDITFLEGEVITLETQGDNEIDLTGNFVYDPENDSDDEGEDSDEDYSGEEGTDIDLSTLDADQIQELIKLGYLNPEDALENGDDSDEEYDSEDAETDGRIREITDEEEAELVEEVVEEPPVKEVKIKKQADKKRKAEEEAEKKVEEATSKKAKLAEKKAKQEAEKKAKAEAEKPKAEAEKKAKSNVREVGGVMVETQKEGEGAGAKNGQRVAMYYIGKLTSGKVFDQNTKGKPFWFRLGAGEVIKGWDKGILGMKRGGERRLTIPASMAYGKRGAPPDIPGNATLVFDIRLIDFK